MKVLIKTTTVTIKTYREVFHGALLTPRQKEITEFLLKGMLVKDIGNKLYISDKTVKFHVTRIYKAFKVKSKKDLIFKVYGVI